MSELRAVELLDNLCKAMHSYTLVTTNNTETGTKSKAWSKVSGEGSITFNHTTMTRPVGDEEDALQKKLEVYCGRVLEDYEDDITESLMSGIAEEQGAQCHNVHAPFCMQCMRMLYECGAYMTTHGTLFGTS